VRMETIGGFLVVNVVKSVTRIPSNHQTGL
jgi:hypothetical protein